MDLETISNPMVAVSPIQDPAITFGAALYFLDGHFLFRHKDGQGWKSKFVTAADVSAAFSGTEQDSGWLPAGIVRTGSNAKGRWYVYSTPAQKIEILFDGEEQPFSIPLPRLVMLGHGANYYLWAMTDVHFNRTSAAFAAPFPNVYSSGLICWGATTPPQADPEKARGLWDLFFSTPFNEHLIEAKSNKYPKNVRHMLRDLATAKKYPADDLMRVSPKISFLIDNTIGAR